MSAKKWVVYLVRCSDSSLYCGISNDLTGRLVEHSSGKGAKYTRSRRPIELAGFSPEMTKSEALKLEYKIKQFPADKKLAKLTKETNAMVMKIITRSKKGVDVPALIKKTGFDDKKIRNILYRQYKQARIKRVGKGIYLGT